jgi:hypothetical protein
LFDFNPEKKSVTVPVEKEKPIPPPPAKIKYVPHSFYYY